MSVHPEANQDLIPPQDITVSKQELPVSRENPNGDPKFTVRVHRSGSAVIIDVYELRYY